MTQRDFIELVRGAVEPAFCADVVRRFDESPEAKPGRVGGGVRPDFKRSLDVHVDDSPAWNDVERHLNRAMLAGLVRYARAYPYFLLAPFGLEVLREDGASRTDLTEEHLRALDDARLGRLLGQVFRPGPINLQRYAAAEGGYPRWHCELSPAHGTTEPLHRVLLWTVYLNDGFEGGETEFLHQQRRVEPETGMLLFAPTAFTHTHRGNTPHGGPKYIATSWVLFRRALGSPPAGPRPATTD